jgi:hypothetical protein
MRRVTIVLSTLLGLALTMASTAVAFADGGGGGWFPK